MNTLYQKIFAAGYDPVMNSIEKRVFHDSRKLLISHLTGKILEVGSGTGVNFKFYNSQADVIAVEPSLPMLQKAKHKATDHQNIQLLNYGINDTELHNVIAPESLDAVVCMLVLCTIPNYKLALENIKKWLKPGGTLIILEHIHSKNKFSQKLQNIINPVWNIIGAGCHLNRSTDIAVNRLGLKLESEVYFAMGLLWYQAVLQK
jgi:ubiquinone/menaquinone biosynthesis C-methylase UbiE